jgi:hypothetical protein
MEFMKRELVVTRGPGYHGLIDNELRPTFRLRKEPVRQAQVKPTQPSTTLPPPTHPRRHFAVQPAAAAPPLRKGTLS